MKVLFVTYCRSMLGANRSMVNLIVDMKIRYGVESHVLMYDIDDGDLTDVLQEQNIPYFIFPMKHWVVSESQSYRYLRGISTWIKNQKNIHTISKQINLTEYDLIYTNNSTVQTGAYLAKKYHLPHIWHIREFGPKDYHIVFNYSEKKVNKWFRQANQVITVSKSLEEYVTSSFAKGAKVTTVYNGVVKQVPGKKVFEKEKNENKESEWKKVIHFCYVGALQEGKNQLELLKALCILKEEIQNIHVDLIGDGAEYRETLEAFVKEKKIQDFVTFWGYQENAEQLLKKMDIGVICAKSEAFGRVTCEYMAASLPVIGANSGGTVEIIDDEQNGLLYELGKETDLANKMKFFIEDTSRIETFAEQAYQKAVDYYTVEKNTDQIYEIIQTVIKK